MNNASTLLSFVIVVHLATCCSQRPATRCEDLKGVQDEGSSKCFFVPDGTLKWIEAENECRAYGGHLASIASSRENDLVQAMSLINGAAGQHEGLWIGFSDAFAIQLPEATKGGTTSLAFLPDGNFMWSDGTATTFTNWVSGQPDDRDMKQDCTIFTPEGEWDDQSCRQKKRFVCSVDTLCHDVGGVEHNGRCFFVPPGKASWDVAESVCDSFNSHLASINSEEENQVVYDHLLRTTTKKEMWIGLSFSVAGDWVSIDGSAGAYRNWASGMPADDGSGCTVMVNNANSSWSDIPCHKSRPFVCASHPRPTAPAWEKESEAYVPCGAYEWRFTRTEEREGGTATWRYRILPQTDPEDNYGDAVLYSINTYDYNDPTMEDYYYDQEFPTYLEFADGCFDEAWSEFVGQ